VAAHVQANAFVVQGKEEQKQIGELMPDILPQLGQDSVNMLKDLIKDYEKHGFPKPTVDEDIPELVEDFEQVALEEESSKD
jgi:phosphate uptake regulator